MNQAKIGEFIKTKRKEKEITQEQLAEMLGVSNKSVSRWENGKCMPDISLFEPLCLSLGITVNELLKGEDIQKENIQKVADVNIIEYGKYLKRKEKVKLVGIVTICGLLTIALLVISILALNKTFFRTVYTSDVLENVNIPIPRYTYYRGTGGLEEYNVKLKTLKQPDEVNIIIDRYLNTLEKVEVNGNTYYYDSYNDFTILQYRINNDGIGFVNTIYITYVKGKGLD